MTQYRKLGKGEFSDYQKIGLKAKILAYKYLLFFTTLKILIIFIKNYTITPVYKEEAAGLTTRNWVRI